MEKNESFPGGQKIPDPDEIIKAEAELRASITAANNQKSLQAFHEKPNPQEAEPKAPVPAETTVIEKDEESKVQKNVEAQIPVLHHRPQPPQQFREEGNVVVAKALAEQLGTSPELKAQMRIDERKFAVLDDVTLAALSHFSYRYVHDGVRYWGHIVEWWLTGSQGIGGLARRHALQAISSSSGSQVQLDKARQPNVIARNITNRKWKEKAEAEGKIVEE